jgi:hypothetical protein
MPSTAGAAKSIQPRIATAIHRSPLMIRLNLPKDRALFSGARASSVDPAEAEKAQNRARQGGS